MKSFSIRFLMVAGSLVLLTSCATKIHLSQTTNPPPSEAFHLFSSFVLEPVALDPSCAENRDSKRAATKIQGWLSTGLEPTLLAWNRENNSKTRPLRTLVIKPVITNIKYVSGATRFWVGPLAGSSAVIVQVTFTERETGKTIATPIFYASAISYMETTAGEADNLMFPRVVQVITAYINNNFTAAIGGETGGQR